MRVFTVVALCALLVLSGVAHAELVGVVITPPILVTFDVEVSYDADGGGGGNGLLTVYAPFDPWGAFKSQQDYSPDGIVSTESPLGYFLLTAEIDKTTLESVSGSVSVSSDRGWDGFLDGDVDFSGGDLDPWEPGERGYSTDLSEFGFGGYGLFDFRFLNATGDLGDPRDSGLLAVIVDGQFDGSGPFSLPAGWDTFQFDFQNSGAGKADVSEPPAPGDFDGDGDIDADDINDLCDNLGGDPATYDVDEDGDVDEDDMIYHIENLVELTDGLRVGTKRGDFNLDGLVNATDLAIMKGTFGASGIGYAGGNANCDDVVNATDLAILKDSFGFAAPTGGVPEPMTLLVMAAAGLPLLLKRKRKSRA